MGAAAGSASPTLNPRWWTAVADPAAKRATALGVNVVALNGGIGPVLPEPGPYAQSAGPILKSDFAFAAKQSAEAVLKAARSEIGT